VLTEPQVVALEKAKADKEGTTPRPASPCDSPWRGTRTPLSD